MASLRRLHRNRGRDSRRVWLGTSLLLSLACAGPPSEPQSVAEAYLEAGRYVDAAREAEAAVRRDPDDIELRMLAAEAHKGAGSHERAIDHLEEALEVAPSEPEISILLGQIEQDRENLEDAYVSFRRATQLAPGELRAWSGLALSAEALGFEEEAAQAYAEWARLEEEQGVAP
jgi:tetratricopeptide (TPR) repeat protein